MAKRPVEREERGFSYKKRPKDNYQERANSRGGNYDTIFKPAYKQWKPKEGKNVIRVLPPTWKGAKHCGLDIYVNYSIGADNQSYLSLSKHDKGDDPIAEARRDAQREGDEEVTKALRPTQRILYWIIDRSDEDEGPLLWAAPFTFDKSLINLCIDEDTKEVIELDHPTEGRDIRFYKEGTGLNTKYDPSRMKLLPQSSIHEDEGQEEEWLAFVQENSLPDTLNFYDYDHIKATFNGQIGGRDEDEDEDEKPAKKRTAARKPRDADEDEDEKPVRRTASRKPPADEDDDADEEDEDVKKPVKDRQHVSSRKHDPKDEPEEDDDEEEDEKPTRGRQRVARKPEPEDDEDEDEDPPSTRRTGKSGGNDEKRASLREKLAARRKRPSSDDEDDE